MKILAVVFFLAYVAIAMSQHTPYHWGGGSAQQNAEQHDLTGQLSPMYSANAQMIRRLMYFAEQQ